MMAFLSDAPVDIISYMKQVVDSVTGTFSLAQIAGVLSAVVGVGIGFVFLWWGVRKAYAFVMSAVQGRRKGL